mmetsp:Transcript_8605/g.16279  ORF Transcript_8605/g.16279 Transcript_8605/m.16279 type:complete len:221 (+) Transcript_8605:62-724(+)
MGGCESKASTLECCETTKFGDGYLDPEQQKILARFPKELESDELIMWCNLECCCSDHRGLLPPRKTNKRSGVLPNNAAKLETLMRQLFDLQDLDGNGVLGENEIIQINETLAFLHQGSQSDMKKVQASYKHLFRSELDPDGKPVPYEIFAAYAQRVLDNADSDPAAQEMMLEQFIAEAQLAREFLMRMPLQDGSFEAVCTERPLLVATRHDLLVGNAPIL